MAASKTTFFGSMYAFEQAGVDEVIDRFCESYADSPDEAPFISYDKQHHLFKLDKLGLFDDDTPETVLRILKLYTEQQHSDPDHLDDRIHPLEGFLSRLVTEQTEYQRPELLDVAAVDEEDASNVLEAIQHNFTEWRPENGNIKILTKGIAESIAGKTRTEILPEPDQKQVRLGHGNFAEALRRLQNLESLLSLQYQQRESGTRRATSNVLINVDEATRPLLGFQGVNYEPYPGYRRIIVPMQDAPSLPGKFVCEARVFQDGKKQPHPNIMKSDKDSHATQAPFSLWSNTDYMEAGNPENMYPRTRASSASQSELTNAQSVKQKYLDPTKAADVAGWAGAIDNNIDPGALEPEQPDEAPTKRVRKVAVDSDDSDNDEDDEDLVLDRQRDLHGSGSPPVEESKRQRVVAPDSDGESDITATPSQSHLQSPEKILSSKLGANSPVGNASMKGGRLLSDISEQKPWSRAPSATQGTDLLKDENAAFEFDTDLPEALARHFTVTDPNGSSRAGSEPNRGRGGRHTTGGPSRSTQQVSRHESDKSQKLLALSQTSSSDLPQVAGSAMISPQALNIMDDMAPLGSPQLRHGEPSNLSSDNGYAADRSVSGLDYWPPGIMPPSNAHRDDQNTSWLESKHYENHAPYKGRNMQMMREAALRKLQTLPPSSTSDRPVVEDQEEESWTTVSRNDQRNKSRGGSQRGGSRRGGGAQGAGRQRKAVELDRARYHSTMGQKAPKPGKGRGGKQKGNSAADKARRAEKMADAYPEPQSRPTNVNNNNSGSSFSEMSMKKKATLSGETQSATSNASLTQEAYRSKETEALKTRLQPIFEASRAFSGDLNFAIHFGQALLDSDPRPDKAKSFDIKSWQEVFEHHALSSQPSVSFTNILTANGAEMDRLLESRSALSPSRKMFDKNKPGRESITYEFHCHDKDGARFLLVLNEDKTYSIRNSDETIGSVCLQCPARVWDALATLEGVDRWNDFPEEIAETVKDFVDSIYIAPSDRLVIYFRQPAGNILTINNPRMKRVSLHQCLMRGYENYQLRITEVKTLYTRNSPEDRKLWKAQEGTYDQAVQDGTLHYEASLIDPSMNSALAGNSNLEVGDLTDAGSTGKALVTTDGLQPMLELTIAVLNKIDHIGLKNIGTMIRLRHAEIQQEQSLPPPLRTQLRSLIPASHTPASAYHASSASVPPGLNSVQDSELGAEVLKPLPGIRMNTLAEVVVDPDGNVYQKGLGGTMVPVPAQRGGLASISEDPIEPGDSASQYGVARRVNGRGGADPGMRSYESWNPTNHRGPGFW